MSTVWGTYWAPPAPRELRLVRATLVVTAVLTVVTVLGYLSLSPVTLDRAGEAVWGLVPAAVALLLARRVGPGRVGVMRGVVVLAVLMALLALGRVAAGEVQGLTNLVLPALLLGLLCRRDVREYLGTRSRPGDGVGPGAGSPVPAAPARPARRLLLFRRSRAGDGGQTTVEAIGVLAVAAVAIGLAAAGLAAAPVPEGTSEVICSINDSESCGGPAGGPSTGPGGGGSGDGSGGADGCVGIGGCALAALGQVGSFLWQVVDAAWDDVVGVFELVMDPGQIIDALRYLLENPGDALWALVWDAESQALWAAGDVGGALGRVAWNVGSLFIPFVGAGKVAAGLGDLGRLGRIGTSADELADLASAGQRAQDAARLGNLDEAAEIAADARRQADELAERADAAGCLSAGTLTLQVLAAGPAGGASTVVVAGGGLCDAAGDAARRADEAADAAAVASSAGRPRPVSVTGPAGEVIPVVPPGAIAQPVRTGKGLMYDVPAGTQGLDPRVAQVRVMDPTSRYPDGYVVYMNANGQAVNPVTGRTVAPADPYWHLPLAGQ